MIQETFEPLQYHTSNYEQKKYQELKRETIAKLNILEEKINKCLTSEFQNEEEIILMIEVLQTIRFEIQHIRNDITLLKNFYNIES
jgi:hypothetical protein